MSDVEQPGKNAFPKGMFRDLVFLNVG